MMPSGAVLAIIIVSKFKIYRTRSNLASGILAEKTRRTFIPRFNDHNYHVKLNDRSETIT